MPVKVKLDSGSHPILGKLIRAALVLALIFVLIGASIFGYFYFRYRGLVAERLAKGPLFAPLAQVYAAPEEVRPGQQLSAASIGAALRRAGYKKNYELFSFEVMCN